MLDAVVQPSLGPDKPLATIKEAQRALRLSREKLYRMKGPGIYRIGRSVRFDLTEVIRAAK